MCLCLVIFCVPPKWNAGSRVGGQGFSLLHLLLYPQQLQLSLVHGRCSVHACRMIEYLAKVCRLLGSGRSSIGPIDGIVIHVNCAGYGAIFRQPTCPRHGFTLIIKLFSTHPKISLTLSHVFHEILGFLIPQLIMLFLTQENPP